MLKKNRTITIINIIYWGLILISTFSQIKIELIEDGVDFSQISSLSGEQFAGFIASMLFLFMFLLFISMFKYFHFTILYFGGIITIKNFYKEKCDITDKKTDTYYRDILKNNSVGVLGYIKDFKVTDCELAATILSLSLKNKISIEDRIIVKDSSHENLNLNESYILENLVNNTYNQINLITFKDKILEDCKRNNLLTEKSDYKQKRKAKIIKNIILFIILILIYNFLPGIFNDFLIYAPDWTQFLFLIILFCGFILLILLPGISFISIIIYEIAHHLDPYVRSKNAMELNEKLNGLENYLKEFSIIHERKTEELVIWKEYLIYSIIFGQNNDIKNEILQKLHY